MTSLSSRRVEPGFPNYSAEAVSPLVAVNAMLNSLVAGRESREKVRGAIVDALYESLEYAEPILAMIQAARDSGKLSRAGYAQLAQEIGRLTTEELSTDVVPEPARLRPGQADSRVASKRSTTANSRRVNFTAAGPPKKVSKPLAAGSVLLGRFELLERIADKGMGQVFRARDRLKAKAGHANTLVAIKLLQPASGDPLYSLQKEALLGQSLNHPNIVNVFDLYEDARQQFITMEWLDGESLAKRLDATRGHPIPAEQARTILEGLAAALTYAHSKGIAHGDIKPGNVQLTAEGEVKLLDFGMARKIGGETAKDAKEVRAVTRAYASCELLEGKLPDVRDDVFSLCCLWYRLITGVRPFGARDALEAERDKPRIKAPRELNRRQWQALKQGLEFRRDQRPDDVASLARVLLHGPVHGTMGKRLATALVLASLAGTASWLYWPEVNHWLDSQMSLRISTLAPATSPPVASAPPELATPAPTLVAPTDVSLPATSDIQPTAAPSPREADEQPIDAVTDEISADKSAAEAASVLATPVIQPEKPTQPVAAEVTAPATGAASATAAETAVPRRFAPLGFRKDQYVVTEGDVAVVLNIDYPRSLNEAVLLSVTIEPSSALPGEDFMPMSNPFIVLGPGEPAATIMMPLISDSVSEYTEEVLVRLTSDNPAIQIARQEAVIIILDDD